MFKGKAQSYRGKLGGITPQHIVVLSHYSRRERYDPFASVYDRDAIVPVEIEMSSA